MDCAEVSMLESASSYRKHIFFANHTSSQLDPEFISTYIAEEQTAGRYSEGFTQEALEQLIGPFRTSPLGLVPKPHSDTFRMIQDMSFPHNREHILSVNAGINSDDFPTAWGSFDVTSTLILSRLPVA